MLFRRCRTVIATTILLLLKVLPLMLQVGLLMCQVLLLLQFGLMLIGWLRRVLRWGWGAMLLWGAGRGRGTGDSIRPREGARRGSTVE